LEALVIVDLLLDLRGLIGGDALGELFAPEETLEHKIRAAFGLGPAFGGGENLLAEATAAEGIDGLHFLQHGGAIQDEGLDLRLHPCAVSI
jgi:hypothetical protein